MIRVAGLHDQVDAGLSDPGPDGRTPSQVIDELRERIVDLCDRQTRCLRRAAAPGAGRARHPHRRPRRRLARARASSSPSASAARSSRCSRRWRSALGRPFPYISNLSLSLAVLVRDPQTGVTHVRAREGARRRCCRASSRSSEDGRRSSRSSRSSPRNLDALFPGMEIVDHGVFRVTRDADFEVSDEADDLLRGGRGRAAPPPLRRGRAPRDRRRHERRAARGS